MTARTYAGLHTPPRATSRTQRRGHATSQAGTPACSAHFARAERRDVPRARDTAGARSSRAFERQAGGSEGGRPRWWRRAWWAASVRGKAVHDDDEAGEREAEDELRASAKARRTSSPCDERRGACHWLAQANHALRHWLVIVQGIGRARPGILLDNGLDVHTAGRGPSVCDGWIVTLLGIGCSMSSHITLSSTPAIGACEVIQSRSSSAERCHWRACIAQLV
ncbi:hypothetical protein NUW54_g10065 [Trametes sanguinea]|uniref:Uncharacterized protein n=1 Tax=Trametes sanguinea TaxID=158606 RepID=A0ACC1P2Y3_9APHY|nr:hypothetical protein NUW54_g10065 [Trametes sanguinea]